MLDPLDDGRDNKTIYHVIITLLQNYGVVLTEHIGDTTLSELGESQISDNEIYQRDVSMLLESNVIVAEVTNPSLGVGYELGFAERHNKKVICLFRNTDNKRLSAMISGNDHFQVITYQQTKQLIPQFEKLFS